MSKYIFLLTIKVKVLHILYQSLPQVSGSSIRSRDILMSQKETGIDVVAVTSSFQGSIDGAKEDMIDGIRYIRTTKKITTSISDQKKSKLSQFSRILALIPFTLKLYKIISKEKPDILHAHAMFYCGVPAIFVGKIKKIPVVYEFRSLWMFQKKNGTKTRLDKLLEQWMLTIETFTLKNANYAVFLNEDLKKYFTSKGQHFKNNAVINNAVNTTYIKQQKIKLTTNSKNDELVFGYIGTLTSYEGIEFLIEVFQELYTEGIKNKLLIYGSGISKKNILKAIESNKEVQTIQYKGNLKPEEVAQAYSNIDVIINPRLSTNVTNSVTPLKPLEAFAFEKLFLGSNVGGILALVEPNKTGFVFEAENKESLKSQIKQTLLLSQQEKETIIKNASKFVETEKSWNTNAEEYKNIYTSLLV